MMRRGIPAVALLLAGCGAHARDRELAQPSTPTPELIRAVESGLRGPVEVAGEKPALMSLADRMASARVPGVSIAVIERGEIAWAKGYGLADGQRAVTPDTLFQAGSISKPVTALVAMREVEAGRLDLDAEVNTVLRSWQIPASPVSAAHPVTLRRLLSHSAGLTVHGFPGYEPGQPLPTLLQILQGQPPANTGPVRVEAQPGSAWRYSGGGYQVVQQMLIDLSGKEFPDMVRARLFRPLGMTRSRFEQLAPGSSAVDVATGHDREGREVSGRWRLFPEMAAAGLWTTPTDLARFVIALQRASQARRGSLVSATTAREMFIRQSGQWGLGFELQSVGRSLRFRHGGDTPGYKAVLVAFPETGQGAVIMTNGDRGYRLIDEILLSIAAAYRWPAYGPKLKTPVKVDAAALDRVVGTYRLDTLPDVQLVVARRGEGLWLRIVQPGAGSESELLPGSPDRFFRRDIDFELLFGPGNPAPNVTLQQDGETYSATRVHEPARGQTPGAELPKYDLTIRLNPTAPRMAAEAIVTVPAPDIGHLSFVLAQMFSVESVELRVNNEFRKSRIDSTPLQGLRPSWGYLRWRILDDDPSLGASRGPLTFRVRYRLDTAATSNVFGIDDAVAFGSGLNTSWYPQIEDGRSLTVGRVRTKRGTGTMRFEVPAGTIVHAIGAPNAGETARQRYVFDVNTPAHFNFAAGRFHVRSSESTERGVPTTLTYYLSPRDSAGTYAKQSLAVLRALSEEFGPYPFDRFAIIELPTDLAQRAGFGGASVEGAILSTTTFLDQPFNSAYYGHEIGHQWWGVTIQPTGARGAMMLQEGMAQYGALRAVELIDGPQLARDFREREYPDYFGQGGELYFRIVDGGNDAPLADLPVNESWARDIADSKGFMAMNALSKEIGRERLRAAFHDILRNFGSARLLWDDFVAAITKAAGRDLSWFFDQWFYKTGAPELAADLDMTARQARVRQLGEPYRLTVDLAFVGPGCALRSRITIAAREERVPFPAGCRPDSVVVDPDYQVLRWTPALRQRYRQAR